MYDYNNERQGTNESAKKTISFFLFPKNQNPTLRNLHMNNGTDMFVDLKSNSKAQKDQNFDFFPLSKENKIC
jgi:hypothetical protein